jgi:hypothetical protein
MHPLNMDFRSPLGEKTYRNPFEKVSCVVHAVDRIAAAERPTAAAAAEAAVWRVSAARSVYVFSILYIG